MVPPPFISFIEGLVTKASEGIEGEGIGSPNVDYFCFGASSLGLSYLGVSIFSSIRPSSPLFLLEEVHSILSDYCSEPLPSANVGVLLTTLYSPSNFLPEILCPSQEGGLGVGVSSPGLDIFFSRVLEELIGPIDQVAAVSPSNLGRVREAKSPDRKRPKQVRKKVPFLWQLEKLLRWKIFPSTMSELWLGMLEVDI